MTDIKDELRGPAMRDNANLGCRAADYIEKLEAHRQFLWDLLDNIDTADDAFKSNNEGYRSFVRTQHDRRFEIGKSDGYKITYEDQKRCRDKGSRY